MACAGESTSSTVSVDLGFAEKCENSFDLSPLFFPSKLGGRPAWLRWDSLPCNNILKCGNCEKQNIFLCQIYVPIELPVEPNEAPQLHHRTIYLFCCRNGPCSKYGLFVKAFRAQRLQTKEDEINEERELDSDKLSDLCKQLEQQQKLCKVCGCFADKSCSMCNSVSYCSKDHQTIDWKYQHKKECNVNDNNPNNVSSSSSSNSTEKHPLLFDEYEIVIEGEPPGQTIKELSESAFEFPALNAVKTSNQQLDMELMKLDEQKVDEYFLNFRERIEREPEQIIRYELGGQPLWVSNENIPSDADIPNCDCGAKRQFEFQVLPQMINYLGVETTIDSIDWGTLCVYTCVDNCGDGNAYKQEFVWKQDFSTADVVS